MAPDHAERVRQCRLDARRHPRGDPPRAPSCTFRQIMLNQEYDAFRTVASRAAVAARRARDDGHRQPVAGLLRVLRRRARRPGAASSASAAPTRSPAPCANSDAGHRRRHRRHVHRHGGHQRQGTIALGQGTQHPGTRSRSGCSTRSTTRPRSSGADARRAARGHRRARARHHRRSQRAADAVRRQGRPRHDRGVRVDVAIAKANKIHGLDDRDLRTPVQWDKPAVLVAGAVVGVRRAHRPVRRGGRAARRGRRAPVHAVASSSRRRVDRGLPAVVGGNPAHERRVAESSASARPDCESRCRASSHRASASTSARRPSCSTPTSVRSCRSYLDATRRPAARRRVPRRVARHAMGGGVQPAPSSAGRRSPRCSPGPSRASLPPSGSASASVTPT